MNPKVIIYLLFSLFVLLVSYESQQAVAVANHHETVSQDEAIRLRILANSDAISDQILKREIRDEVNAAITEWVTGLIDLEDAKNEITNNLPEIEAIVARELEKQGLSQQFTVSFDEVQFPTKLYGNLVYPAGMYDAVLITLGEGKGENWWCVLFPPLCFLDMANGEAVEPSSDGSTDEKTEEVEVTFFVVEIFSSIIDSLFGNDQA
ncbi:stage II sporulation protein R [Alkalihalophilus lindianensis]|uniref:Stage II sporulation protein R n=1 Tax=Alkalihalophilus lindianensis TaxID=1630542 RepID=A0ABU3X9G1_9BACI|nr:stage II sporulation protein R [Alkalihalophilus lindianensis]MDV2684530.1 stage II sporulation protein R [Alkalihalophilus lindianensis]